MLVCFSSIQDIFDWIFEVDDTNSNADRCRLSFSIEYEMSFGHRVKYGVIENKATVRIQIHQDKTFAIVPVVKVCHMKIQGQTGMGCCRPSLEFRIIDPSRRPLVAALSITNISGP